MCDDLHWYLYVLRCADGSLYTGITTDVEKRIEAHNAGKGAKYTKGHRRPVRLLRSWGPFDESSARRYEAKFKQRSRKHKELYISDYVTDWIPMALSCSNHTEAQRLLAPTPAQLRARYQDPEMDAVRHDPAAREALLAERRARSHERAYAHVTIWE